MDLIDLSNSGEPIPIIPQAGDPIPTDLHTGNTVATNTADTDMDIIMAKIGDTTMGDTDTTMTLPHRSGPVTPRKPKQPHYTPTVFDFSTLSPSDRIKVSCLRSSISQYWNLTTPAAAFPQKYLPDPDSHNWGPALLEALNNLARLSRLKYKLQAIFYVVYHLKDRNGKEVRKPGVGHWRDEDITPRMVIEGDFVVRVEDVVYAIGMAMRVIPEEERVLHQDVDGVVRVGGGKGKENGWGKGKGRGKGPAHEFPRGEWW